MARSINKVLLIGNLGTDPESLRYTPAGIAVINVRIATNESWKDKQSNEIQQRTEWHRVVLYGRLAEIVQQYLRKGSKVWVEGRLQTREWDNKEGQKQYTTEIVANDIVMLDSRGSAPDNSWENNTAPSKKASAPVQTNADTHYKEEETFDDDIPF